MPACPQSPSRSLAPSGPLNSLKPWPHQQYPLQAELRLKQTTVRMAEQNKQNPLGISALPPVRAVEPAPVQAAKPGQGKRCCWPLEGPALLEEIRLWPSTSSTLPIFPRVPTCVCCQKPEGSWPAWGRGSRLCILPPDTGRWVRASG